jgi:hypothetical protein
MEGSKFIRSLVAEAGRDYVATVLRIRFGDEAGSTAVALLQPIEDPERLRELLALAIRCASLDEFRAGLAAPPPPGPPPRRRARSGNR